MNETNYIPPHDINAELCTLGAMMLDARAVDNVREVVTETDFYREAHTHIYAAMLRLSDRGTPPDIITLRDELSRRKILESIGGIGYLMQLGELLPTTANAVYHARIVREKAIQRALIRTCDTVKSLAYTGISQAGEASPVAVCRDAESLILAATEPLTMAIAGGNYADREEPVRIGKLAMEELFEIEERGKRGTGLRGVSTGFSAVDKITGGLAPHDLVLLAARPSVGKSSLAQTIAVNAAKTGAGVVVFSLEMTKSKYTARLIAAEARINLRAVLTGRMPLGNGDSRELTHDEQDRLRSAAERLYDLPLLIDDTRGLTPQNLKARLRRVKRDLDGQVDVVIIDHAGLMQSGKTPDGRRFGSDYEATTAISHGVQDIARGDTGACVLTVLQLNREVEKRGDKRPNLADLRGSGAWEEDADIICFLYRPDYYEDKTDESDTTHGGTTHPTPSEVQLLFEKNRDGMTAMCKLNFLKEYSRFDALTYKEGF